MSTVCVIIAAYNAESTIARAIASALAETETGQVIVVDDASGDGTVARARAADDGTGRLLILEQARNAGPAAARNRALAAAESPWISILDADDFFLPGRLTALLAHAAEADMIADDMWQADEADVDGPRRRLLDSEMAGPRRIDFKAFVLSNVTRRGRQRAELGFIKPLLRREFLTAHNLRYRENMRLGEDFELYARALALGARLVLIPDAFYVSVVRENSLSGRHSEDDLRCLRDGDRDLAAELPLQGAEKAALERHTKSIDCRLQWRLLILAVKQRNAGAALAAFRRPWPVPLYLLEKLLEQAWRRSVGLIRRQPAPGGSAPAGG
jgi:succinoglycan biosynthesis protein ExoU